jgi:hypothetical protein
MEQLSSGIPTPMTADADGSYLPSGGLTLPNKVSRFSPDFSWNVARDGV